MTFSSPRLTIVVGASRGIGRHLALRAAEHGHAVIGCARDGVALADVAASAEPTSSFEVLTGDFLADPAAVKDLTARLDGHTGPVSLIITAATIGPVGPLTLVDIEAWSQALVSNVVGAARLFGAAVPALGPADLIVVFSGGGVGGPNPQPNVSGYTTSKAALMHLVEVTAREHPDGPTLVAIAPGAFPTGFTDPVLAVDPSLAGAALLEDVGRTKAGEFDATDLDTLLDYLEGSDVGWLSGRSISARRDGPSTLAEHKSADPGNDLYRLRRVDGVGITVQAW